MTPARVSSLFRQQRSPPPPNPSGEQKRQNSPSIESSSQLTARLPCVSLVVLDGPGLLRPARHLETVYVDALSLRKEGPMVGNASRQQG